MNEPKYYVPKKKDPYASFIPFKVTFFKQFYSYDFQIFIKKSLSLTTTMDRFM